jgi:hypothetical protein
VRGGSASAQKSEWREIMEIVASYDVNNALYSAEMHNIELSTTEYTYGNDMVVHQQYGKNLGIRLDNLLRYTFKKNTVMGREIFFSKKTYNSSNPNVVTQSTFDAKISRFDLAQTVIEQEILESYSYVDKNGKPESIQIVVKVKGMDMSATIDFKNMEQYSNFVCPAWLVPLSENKEAL